jgi:hypothetical protein
MFHSRQSFVHPCGTHTVLIFCAVIKFLVIVIFECYMN